MKDILSLPLFNLAEARVQRDRGLAISASFPNDEYVTKARSVAELLAAKNGTVTINDVLRICPKPDSVHCNALGSVMRSPRLKLVSYTQSEKVSAHARRIGVYNYVN